MAHQDSFDPKPYAPIEYRGEIGTTKTKVEGVFFSEYLKQTADIADKITVCRSMTHGEAAHERGTHNMFTGYRPSPALVFPSMGSIVSHELGVRNNLPPYVCVPSQPTTFAGSGYLSSAYAPFSLGADPANGNFNVQDLTLPGGVDDKRFDNRKNMLEAVNDHFAKTEKADGLVAMDTFYQRAYAMISSAAAREAFNINAETPKIRDEYGRNAAGQRMLLARRLVAAGVRFVSLTYGGWDMHTGIKGGMAGQLPAFDQAYAAADSRPGSQRSVEEHAGHGVVGVRSHAEDQRLGRPRPLAEGVQRGTGRRRRQGGPHLWHQRRNGHRAGKRSADGRGSGRDGLSPDRH